MRAKTPGYCWPTSFKVLGVLFLGEASSAFWPSKKACWTHQFQCLGVGQQYREVFLVMYQCSWSSSLYYTNANVFTRPINYITTPPIPLRHTCLVLGLIW